MDKLTYLAELAEGLARWVPERERQDILRYYAEYFEEAGPEREAQVVAELGDPWALSCRLAVEGGYVTQEQANSWAPRKKKKWPWIVAGCAVLAVTLIGGLFKALTGIGWFLWNNVASSRPYQTDVPVAVVEGGTAYERSDNGITYIYEGEEYLGGCYSKADGTLERFDSIDADISLGNITVCTGADYTLAIQQSSYLGGYSVKWTVRDGNLKIEDDGASNEAKVNNWSDLKEGLQGLLGNRALDVIVTVPEGVELEKLDVKTNLGNVFLSDFLVRGKLEAKTDMGNVECYEARAMKKLDLKTSMGDVILGLTEMYDGVDIDLETSMGQVEANLNCHEYECEYEVKTDMGTVIVNGVERGSKAVRKGGSSYKLDAESSMGDVNVYFFGD